MRRFITSLPGKVISNLIVLALVLPSISLVLAARADAQVAVLPSWAVSEFKNLKSPGTVFGKTAADAVSSEILKTGQYEVVSQETVARGATSLGISLPAEGVNLMRLAQEVRASTMVTGEIANYNVVNTGSGKMARVTMRVVAYDVASSLAINGAIVNADSTTRPGDVSDETLINDAIQQAASMAIKAIQSRNLPIGTVLNTTTSAALVNKGTREGFREGQEIIVLRDGMQVASGHVSSVSPDSSTVSIENFSRGVKPGDKVRALFSVPALTIAADGTAKPASTRSKGPSSALITTLLIIGLVVLVAGGSNASDNSAIGSVQARPTLDEAENPAVRVSWSPNGFVKGNQQRTQFQIWRSDVVDSPVLTVPGGQTTALDRGEVRNVSWAQFAGQVLSSCGNTSPTDSDAEGVPGVRAGRPYIYSVDLVYNMNSIDLPGGGSGGGGGGTGATAGGTGATAGGTGATAGTNAGTAGTTGGLISGGDGFDGLVSFEPEPEAYYEPMAMMQTTGSQVCYFVSPKRASSGTATPLLRTTHNSPADNAPVSVPTKFSFQSAIQQTPIVIEYVIQFSDSVLFPKSRSVIVAQFNSNRTGIVTTEQAINVNSSSMPPYILAAQTVYWRIGARNPLDRPGPLPDPATGQPFIFSGARPFTRPGGPPPPPGG